MQQRFSSLAHWGAFTALVDDGRFVRAEPFPADPAPSRLLEAMPAIVYSDKRVRRPAVRRDWLARRDRARSGSNVFVEVEWDHALDLAAGELARVRGLHGAEGIFGGSYGWSSAGRFHHARTQLRRFLFAGGGCVDQIGNYSWGAAQTLLPHVIGTFEPVAGKSTDWRSIVSDCEVFVAFGGLALRNAQVTAGGCGEHTLADWLRKCKAAGVRFVNVGPNRNDCPDWLGAQWIAVRPGTDTALMLAVAFDLIERDVHDRAFLERCCTGFERFAAYVQGRSDGAPKTPEWAAPICGVDAATIRELARTLTGVRSMISLTWSIQRAHHGEQPYWMGVTLAAMLGAIGLPGGGFGFGHGSMNGVAIPRTPVAAPELGAGHNPAAGHNIPVARMADLLLSPGAEYDFNGARRRYGDVRLVWWAGGNPFHHHQDLNRLRRAWERPETVIVNESHWTATAQRADIVLPATTTLEREDIGGNSRDRYVFAMRRAIAPLHQSRNDFAIFSDLAARLGCLGSFADGRTEDDWIRLLYERQADSARHAGVDLPEFDAWRAAGHCDLRAPERPFVLFEAFRGDPQAHPLRTPSGRIEISSATIGAMGYADCGPHPMWLPPDECLPSSTGTGVGSRTLHLLTTQPPDKLHSQADFGPVAASFKRGGREVVRFNPADAAARGIGDGDVVRLFNDRGACQASALIDAGVMAGVAVLATGAWYAPDAAGEDTAGNPNVLAADRGTSCLTQGCAALSLLVEARRVALG